MTAMIATKQNERSLLVEEGTDFFFLTDSLEQLIVCSHITIKE